MSLTVSLTTRGLDIAFEAPIPGIIALFGPSGSGKTSTLLAIAGLLPAARVAVTLDGYALHSLRPEQRGIGYVFQEGRLFPHMSVAANLRYGLRRAPPGPVALPAVVELLGIGALLGRQPATLSGGERQRVAIGRALLAQPRLLLMDEPLSALDQPRRDEIIPYLARLGRELAIPVVYASHALDEVMRLADTLVLLEGGRVRACGPLGDVVADAGLPLAAREDAGGVLRGTLAGHDAARGLSSIDVGGATIVVPLLDASVGTRVRLLVPAREVILAREAPAAISVNNVVPARIVQIAQDEAAHAALITLELGGGLLLARITLDAASRLGLAPGARILALIKSMSAEPIKE